MTVLIEGLHLQNETLVNGVQDMGPKIINWGSDQVCQQFPCLSNTQK